jgi:hypothetical protein
MIPTIVSHDFLQVDSIWKVKVKFLGRNSVVALVDGYGLDGPGIDFRWGRDFPHPPIPSLEPTQSPAQWLPNLLSLR